LVTTGGRLPGDSDQQRRAVLDMLASASYSERDRVSVGGPFA
jgi:hypothetical protein